MSTSSICHGKPRISPSDARMSFATSAKGALRKQVAMTTSITDARSTADSLIERFQARYRTRPRIFRAPGRVNLIGEHTDYNDGFVMPAAIDFSTWIAISKRNDRVLDAYSEQFTEAINLSLDALAPARRKHWSDFVRGVAALLQQARCEISGANLVLHGEVPLGAGLSSSAALEVSVALALLSISNCQLAPLEIAKVCQRAEHEYVGTRCGIMDQFIAVFGTSGHALLLDCRSLEYRLHPLSPGVRLLLCNSMVKHEHAAGEYNQRRSDCEAGVQALRQYLPNIRALRDVTLNELEQYKTELPPLVYQRCRHVITENSRVLEAGKALQSGDLVHFGELMYQSHTSLRDAYEVSCEELDLLVELASVCEGVYGARMTGGGFGGCTINLVRADSVDRVQRQIAEGYQLKTGRAPEIYVCAAAQGAGEW
jgi:galactokinase